MTYQELINSILQLQEEGLEIFNAGKSVLGKNILATHVGSYDGNQILFQAGIHAREWITTSLLVEMARNLHNNNSIQNGGVYFVFLVNPDGAQIALDGINSLNCQITKDYLISANGGSLDFKTYKANVNLVDLNTNFDASWGGGSQNVFCPATENFVGFYSESEREVNSLIDFTLKVRPIITVSYHSKGNVIYYGFENEGTSDYFRDKEIGEGLSNLTGYPLIYTRNSTGGYKDWCISSLKIPAYTIEVGDENLPHPIGIENLPEIYFRNKDVPIFLLNIANEYANEIDFGSNFMQNNIIETNGEINNGTNGRSYLLRLQSYAKRRNTNRRSYSKKW